MNRPRFEKFEMKYGYYFPEEFKQFMYKYGGDVQFGSCRFEYPDNIINNVLRIPLEMDFHLVPFGEVGNGDYYCFYRYGLNQSDYYIGIWLHETRNFVILSSNFKGFMYKCLLDDYLSTVMPGEEAVDESLRVDLSESLERCVELSSEFNFDFEKVKKMKGEYDYHKLMIEYDNKAIQSLCFIGKALISKRDIRGFDVLDSAKTIYKYYTAPYYLTGKTMLSIGKNAKSYFLQGLKTSLVMTGYSYWQEDYLEIPEDVHREIALYADKYMEGSSDFLEKSVYEGKDPYDYEFRFELAKNCIQNNQYTHSMVEYNNALFCCDEKEASREILKEALQDAKNSGLYHLINLIEHDIRVLR